MTKQIQYETVKAKSREEALEKSSLRVGQLLRIRDLQCHGNVAGEWTIIPQLETVETEKK